MIAENNLIPEKVASLIQRLLNNESQLKQMREESLKLGKPSATSEIVDHSMALIRA